MTRSSRIGSIQASSSSGQTTWIGAPRGWWMAPRLRRISAALVFTRAGLSSPSSERAMLTKFLTSVAMRRSARCVLDSASSLSLLRLAASMSAR